MLTLLLNQSILFIKNISKIKVYFLIVVTSFSGVQTFEVVFNLVDS